MRQVGPVTDTNFGQGAALAPSTLDAVVPVAVLLGVFRVAGTQLRARADTELAFRELAFDGDALGSGVEKHIDTRRSRLAQAANFVLKDEGRAARIFEKGRSSALGDHAIEQVEAAEGANRSEHTLRE